MGCFRANFQKQGEKRKRIEKQKEKKEKKAAVKSKAKPGAKSKADNIKKPMSAYLLYCQAKREKVPALSPRHIACMAGRMHTPRIGGAGCG